jgi:hypothetical protein
VGVEGADGGFVVVFSGGEADGRLVEPEILVLRVLSDVSLSLKGEDGVNGWDGEGWYASVSRRNEAEADIKARLTFGVKEGENLGELLLPRAMVVVPIVIMLVIMLVFLLSSLVIVSSLSGVLMVLLLAVRLSDKLRIVSGFLGNDGGRDLSVEDALDSDEGFFSDDFEFAVRKNGGGGKGIELRQIETRRRGGEEGSDGVKNGVERLEAEGVEMILEVKRYQRDQQLIQHRSTLQPVSARLGQGDERLTSSAQSPKTFLSFMTFSLSAMTSFDCLTPISDAPSSFLSTPSSTFLFSSASCWNDPQTPLLLGRAFLAFHPPVAHA